MLKHLHHVQVLLPDPEVALQQQTLDVGVCAGQLMGPEDSAQELDLDTVRHIIVHQRLNQLQPWGRFSMKSRHTGRDKCRVATNSMLLTLSKLGLYAQPAVRQLA